LIKPDQHHYQYLGIDGNNTQKINKLKEIFGTSPAGAKGIEELEFIVNFHSLFTFTIDH